MKSLIYPSFLFFILLGIVGPAQAKVVDKSTAEKAAINFFYERLGQKSMNDRSHIVVRETYTITDNSLPSYYAVNFEDGGFVLISADDIVSPVIGYSPDGRYSLQDQPVSFSSWMDYMKGQIRYYREINAQADLQITKEWNRLTENELTPQDIVFDSKDVEPLMNVKWGQGKYFNTLCPLDAGGDVGHVVTGCVATAMAQIIYHYRYPATGYGSHSYNANNPTGNPNYGVYGVQSADFGATTYDYNEMVDLPTEANLSIAKLMYHCGVSVNMGYGPGASGAYTNDVPYALMTYFKYSGGMSYVTRLSVPSQNQWETMIMGNLDTKQPVMYSGVSSQGGHCFITDGYQIQGLTKMFHFNWGWDGNYDGYYGVNNLNPGGDPPYSSSQSIVRNIYPGNNFPPQCTGQKVITSTKGTLEDGSGPGENYLNNANCSWLIAPTDSVKKIQLSFNKFETQAGIDSVVIYDGDNTSAPVLFSHSGNTVPASTIYSTKNKMLITFVSDGDSTKSGFFATFKSQYPTYCSGTNLTAPSGTISDGSGSKNYNNNSTCTWIIQPPNATSLTLTFTSFETEAVDDYLNVYDLTTQTLLNTYSGNTLPAPVTSPSGAMYLEFKTNYVFTFPGWSAAYSISGIGFEELNGISDLHIFPNPANELLNVDFKLETQGQLSLILYNPTGQCVYSEQYDNFSGKYDQDIDLSSLAEGIYFLKIQTAQGSSYQKIIVQ